MFFLFKFIYNLHKWDSIKREFKSAFIKSLTKIFLLCKIYVQFLEFFFFFFAQYDYVQLTKKTFCNVLQIVITHR
jgi:hypothetical protein